MTPEQQLQAVRDALVLDHAPDDRLSWLETLLAELLVSRWLERQEDPDAATECLRECYGLLRGLKKAFAHEWAAAVVPAETCEAFDPEEFPY